jgi:hypothetical protein
MIKKNVGVIGYGSWAKKILPTINNLSNVKFIINSKINYKTLNLDLDLDWIIVLTSNKTHFDIVKFFLKNGNNVICEKPLTETYKNSNYLYQLAKKKNLKLYVNDVEIYKYKKIKILKKNYIVRLKKDGLKKGNLLFRLVYHDLYLLSKYLNRKKIGKITIIKKSKEKLEFNFYCNNKKFDFLYSLNSTTNQHKINKINFLDFKFDPLTKMFKNIFNNKANFKENKMHTLCASKIITQLKKYDIE